MRGLCLLIRRRGIAWLDRFAITTAEHMLWQIVLKRPLLRHARRLGGCHARYNCDAIAIWNRNIGIFAYRHSGSLNRDLDYSVMSRRERGMLFLDAPSENVYERIAIVLSNIQHNWTKPFFRQEFESARLCQSGEIVFHLFHSRHSFRGIFIGARDVRYFGRLKA